MSTPPKDWDARKGGIVRKRRQALDLEQRDLAEQVGVHVNSVQRWESGKQYPGRHLGKLESVLGIVIDGDPEPEDAEKLSPGEVADLRAHIREILGEGSAVEAALDADLYGGDPPPTPPSSGRRAGAAAASSSRRRVLPPTG